MARLAVLGAGVAAVASCSSLPPGVVLGTPGTTTAGQAPRPVDYARLETDILAELNSARTAPRAFAVNLEPLLPAFNGKLLQRPGWPAPVKTQEGATAVREAINFVQLQAPVPALTLDVNLSRAARDLANDQSRTGGTGHVSSDRASTADRISRYGVWGSSYNENIDYGPVITGRDVIQDMIIDDGVPDRGHRRNTFDPSVRVVGIGCAPHTRYGVVCVIDAVGAYTPR